MTRLVLSPDTIMRASRGRLLVHTTSSAAPAFETGQPMLVGWLCQFALPIDVADALAVLPANQREQAQRVIDLLVRNGSLAPVDQQPESPATDARAAAQARQHLSFLSRSVYEFACDALGFGPWIERALRERTGIGVERRVLAMLAAIGQLREEMLSLREQYLTQQLKALNVAPQAKNLRIHLGCGKALLDGWINIDVHPAPLAMNMQWPLPFAVGSANYVFASHVLEHLYFPRDVQPFIAEVFRVLAPKGVVRFVVPDIEQCIAAYSANNRTFFASRRDSWPWWPANPTRLEDFLAYAGAGAEPAHSFESHKYGYDYETLERTLVAAGFVDVVKSGYMQSQHDALRVDDRSDVAKAKYGDRYYSLFVEASKPG